MIKAVFFDLYQTLVSFDPPREELQAQALSDFGIRVKPEALRHPLLKADEYFYQENARSPLSKRSPQDKIAVYSQYQTIVLKEAGIEPSRELIGGIMGKWQKLQFKLVLFDDVVPLLTDLKNRGLILGLISNVDRDMTPLLEKLGLAPLLQVIITSQDTGYTKPQPEIFQEALRQAKVRASEAIYVGDQYQIDILGAQKAGIQGVLLDRGGYFNELSDCRRIQSLYQLAEHLKQ